jgi:large subunit ribosomal protein L18
MDKHKQRTQRKKRMRRRILVSNDRPRLTVFRSNKYVYAQIIDDSKGKTIVAYSSKDLPKTKAGKSGIEIAGAVGEELAKKAKAKKIKKVIFDRGGYKYHGKVKAIAEGARKGGLEF